MKGAIIIKSPTELARMRETCRLVAEVLEGVRAMVAPGVTTRALDEYVEQQTRAAGAVPAFKGYKGFPASLCTSVNEEVVHGIPSDRRLRAGDILSIDFGAVLEGYYGDSAVTVPVGEVDEHSAALLRVTEEALFEGIAAARIGNRVSDIGHAVGRHVERHGFSIVREFVGHGIGISLHEEPQVPNYGEPGRGPRLSEGMVLAIEPMVNMGAGGVKILSDGWTAVTRDGSRSAHFEHVVAVTAEGPWILTLPGTDDRRAPASADSRVNAAGA